jgi:hypothetical protein
MNFYTLATFKKKKKATVPYAPIFSRTKQIRLVGLPAQQAGFTIPHQIWQ